MLAVRLAQGLNKAGHNVHILALGDGDSLHVILQRANIDHFALNSVKGISLVAMFRLYRHIKETKTELIVSNHFRQLVHSWAPAAIARISHYHIEHDNLIYRNNKKYLFLLRFFITRLQQLIVISPTLQRWFKSQLPTRTPLVLIPNGVDTALFFPSKESKSNFHRANNIDNNCIIIGTCARLEPIKNIDLMLLIFHKYHRNQPNSRLLIVGDGSCRKELEKKVHELEITKAVLFVGMQPDVLPWLQAMDIYLLTSNDEGLPLSVLEALSCGVPVVARNVGDLHRILDNRFGQLIDSTNTFDWLSAIDRICSDSKEYKTYSQNARKTARVNYSMNSCIKKYLEILP